MANQLIYNNNKKRYTYISVLSFKKFDRLCFSIYQLYFSTCRLAHSSCLYFCRSRSRSGDVAKGHHLSDNLRTTLTILILNNTYIKLLMHYFQLLISSDNLKCPWYLLNVKCINPLKTNNNIARETNIQILEKQIFYFIIFYSNTK